MRRDSNSPPTSLRKIARQELQELHTPASVRRADTLSERGHRGGSAAASDTLHRKATTQVQGIDRDRHGPLLREEGLTLSGDVSLA